jgi:uncharacterized protein YndB with AHSA1/START domain
MIDVNSQISAIGRTLASGELPAGEARVVTVARTYACPIDEVWGACTTADRIARWFLPISGDLGPGGRFQLEGNAGGVVEECEPPHRFAVTWEYDGDVSWVVVGLSEVDGGTRFALQHTLHVDNDHWREFGPGAVGIGWDMAVLGLSLHLAGGDVRDPVEAAAWPVTAEGRSFMRHSGEAWHHASVAGGEDPEWSREAADRTIAAYTAHHG